MKKLFLSLTLLLSIGMLTACGDKTTSNNTTTPLNQFRETLTLQGKIMDATTGAGLGGPDLHVYLIQGTLNRMPDKLVTDANSALVGEYAFSNIPIAYTTNNTAYKVVVVKNGYQRFEGEFLFDANYISGNVVDTAYNWIGNIYLYQEGATAGSLTIDVVSPTGKPIPNATVLLQQNINTNTAVNGTTGSTGSTIPNTIAGTTLNATDNLASSLSGTTDANGAIVFSGSSLALGANYTPTVLPISFENQQLGTSAGAVVTIGTSNDAQLIQMSDLEPTANGLYVVYASTPATGAVTGAGANAGVLTVVFNRPITLYDETRFTATLAGAGPYSAVLNGDGTDTAVTATVSADGYTLTLTPQWTTAPVSTDKLLSVQYTDLGASFYVQGYPGTAYSLFGGGGTQVLNISAATVSTTVPILGN